MLLQTDESSETFLPNFFTWSFLESNEELDSSLFFCRKQGKLLLVLVYVDDILLIGKDFQLIQQLASDLNSQFALKVLGPVNYFLGFEAYNRDATGLYLTQTKYTQDLLMKTKMQIAKATPTPGVPNEELSKFEGVPLQDSSQYRSVIRALQYLTMTRPDIAFSVNKLSQFLQSSTDVNWAACKRILRHLQGTSHYGICFKPAKLLNLEAFLDADWAGNKDNRRSITGYCVYLGGNLISWCSRK